MSHGNHVNVAKQKKTKSGRFKPRNKTGHRPKAMSRARSKKRY